MFIHQIWFGTIPNKKQAAKEFPKFRKNIQSWRNMNPEWKYHLWNKKECEELIKEHFPQHLKTYQSYPYEIQRCDYVRYCILYIYGGIYADIDTECLVPFTSVFESYQNPIYFVETGNKLGENVHISNLLMYSEEGHPFLKVVIDELPNRAKQPMGITRHMQIMFSTGPGVLNELFQKGKEQFGLDYFPKEFFNPLEIGMSRMNIDKSKYYVIHYGKGSWEAGDSKVWLFLYKNGGLLLLLISILVLPQLLLSFRRKIEIPKIEKAEQFEISPEIDQEIANQMKMFDSFEV